MTDRRLHGSETVRIIRAFIASYDVRDASDREVALRIRERLHRELYRREREHYSEFVDVGGEA